MGLELPKIPSLPSLGDLTDKLKENVLGEYSKQGLDIETYRAKFLGANARSHLFVCRIEFPGVQNALKSGLEGTLAGMGGKGFLDNIGNGLVSGATGMINSYGTSEGTENFKYYVKSTSLPESILEETSTYFAGRQLKMPSVRRTQDWSVTFLVNNDASIIRKFWDWQLLIENPETGVYGKPKDFMTDQVVQLLGMDGSVVCTYKLFGAWPKQLGAVSLDYMTNEFATIDVTFSYQYHTITEKAEPALLTAGRKSLQSLGTGGVADMFKSVFK